MPVPITPTLASVQAAVRASGLAVPLPPGGQRASATPQGAAMPVEIGGPAGPEPTRYGDWERRGRCIDF